MCQVFPFFRKSITILLLGKPWMKGELFIMSKFFKKILGVAAIGTAVAGAIYYFKKNQESDEDFEDEFEDEDFDLDNDLKPVTDREYVSLTPKSKEEKEDAEKDSETEDADAKPAGKDAEDQKPSKTDEAKEEPDKNDQAEGSEDE